MTTAQRERELAGLENMSNRELYELLPETKKQDVRNDFLDSGENAWEASDNLLRLDGQDLVDYQLDFRNRFDTYIDQTDIRWRFSDVIERVWLEQNAPDEE